ncbi:MAG: 2-oxoglutarate dehydrogenase complex dihydrolipoyllysine-residue succinyltransferase [Chitinophagales bacterium]
MAIIELRVPEIGESVTEVTVAGFLVEEGDTVELDQALLEFDSDKATLEFPSPAAGVVHFVVEEGQDLNIGDLVGTVETEVAASTSTPPSQDSPEPVAPATPDAGPTATGETIQMLVPEIGESVTEVTVAGFLVEEGDFVEMDQALVEFDSDKATLEFPSPGTGIVHFVVEEGQDLKIGDTVGTIQVMTGNPQASSTPANSPSTQDVQTPSAGNNTSGYASGHPSPAADKVLRENKVDAAQVKGTGVGGRITKSDAINHVKNTPAQKTAPTKAPVSPKKEVAKTATPAPSGNRNVRTERLSRIRKTISRRLVAVKNETAMLTTFNEVDLTEIIALRKRYKEQFKEKHQIGLGYMSFFSKACAFALMDYPGVNAYIDVENGTAEYHDYVDISIAVSTPKGLVVPVMRNVEEMSLKKIEQTVRELALKGRDGKLTMAEMDGGTFTITNGGIFGSMLSTPIINAPQSAILGMHNILQRPMAVNGEVKIRPMMYLALSYDHRIIDGKQAVQFLVRVKQLLEDPIKLFLDL